MFVHSRLEPTRGLIAIGHLIDGCISFSRTGLTTKTEEALTQFIGQVWISLFGPMTTLTLVSRLV